MIAGSAVAATTTSASAGHYFTKISQTGDIHEAMYVPEVGSA